jgi:hypothetical protein
MAYFIKAEVFWNIVGTSLTQKFLFKDKSLNLVEASEVFTYRQLFAR